MSLHLRKCLYMIKSTSLKVLARMVLSQEGVLIMGCLPKRSTYARDGACRKVLVIPPLNRDCKSSIARGKVSRGQIKEQLIYMG